jgi:hypothetical protein
VTLRSAESGGELVADRSDQELWAAVVEARRELHRVQADFYQNAHDRAEVLRAALAQRGWDQTTALRYLDVFSDDTLTLLPPLVDLAVSDRTHGWACEAIGRVSLDKLLPRLEPIIAERLATEDWFEYQCIGGLLGRIQAWNLLSDLVRRALSSTDPEVREAGENMQEHYTVLRLAQEPPFDATG